MADWLGGRLDQPAAGQPAGFWLSGVARAAPDLPVVFVSVDFSPRDAEKHNEFNGFRVLPMPPAGVLGTAEPGRV